MLPDFSAINKTADTLVKQFEQIIELLQRIEENTRPRDTLNEEQDHG